jgi:protein subunit release factor B
MLDADAPIWLWLILTFIFAAAAYAIAYELGRQEREQDREQRKALAAEVEWYRAALVAEDARSRRLGDLITEYTTRQRDARTIAAAAGYGKDAPAEQQHRTP